MPREIYRLFPLIKDGEWSTEDKNGTMDIGYTEKTPKDLEITLKWDDKNWQVDSKYIFWSGPDEILNDPKTLFQGLQESKYNIKIQIKCVPDPDNWYKFRFEAYVSL